MWRKELQWEFKSENSTKPTNDEKNFKPRIPYPNNYQSDVKNFYMQSFKTYNAYVRVL
jgi:hypothetical protein